MGEGSKGVAAGEGNCFGSSKAHHVGVSPQEDRSGTAGEVGEVESKAEEESNLNVECNRRQTLETCESLQQPNRLI